MTKGNSYVEDTKTVKIAALGAFAFALALVALLILLNNFARPPAIIAANPVHQPPAVPAYIDVNPADIEHVAAPPPPAGEQTDDN